ncbi:MAG: pyruvate formate lyase-activating protein [Leptolyngbya sp. SIOISBB]|nr:pyruvate formate lyase-activating protein [Leptolyngbya sp. SIOISBB]
MTTGRIHSIETCGTVDGPGLRFVIFTQGCPLRCLYCHNSDCHPPDGGREVTVDDLIQEIQRYRSYLRQGGVTVTGGEPLMQPEFVAEILQRCQAIGLHTALDTSGYVPIAAAQPVLDHADLVLLDIKSYDPDLYRYVTQVTLEPTLRFAQYLAEIHKPTWVRFVLVPGLTDRVDNVDGLAKFVATLGNVERVEVLPFHQMGAYKWAQMGHDYALQDTPPPSSELVEDTVARFTARGLTAIGN